MNRKANKKRIIFLFFLAVSLQNTVETKCEKLPSNGKKLPSNGKKLLIFF
jgi:hypothetical protein